MLLIFRSIKPRHTTNTRGTKFVIQRINHIGTTESFVALIFPLGNQGGIDEFMVNAVLIDSPRNALVRVVKFVNVPRFLPIDLMNRPDRLGLARGFTEIWKKPFLKNKKIKTIS